MKQTLFVLILITLQTICLRGAQVATNIDTLIPPYLRASITKVEKELINKYGYGQKDRIQRGIRQVALFWQKEDGDIRTFESFVLGNYIGDEALLNEMFQRLSRKFEALDGYMAEIAYELRREMDLDTGKILPLDELFGSYDPSSHINEDFFKNKIAFIILLNFPITTFEERKKDGASWSRKKWAEVRLAQRFSKRIPSGILQQIAFACSRGELYTSEYKIWMHHVLSPDNERLFPEGVKLISHWNLRDEIKAQYAKTNGLIRQKTIQKIMERIINQTIPQVVINNPSYDWNPFTNSIKPTDSHNEQKQFTPLKNQAFLDKPEGNKRYEILLDIFKSIRAADKYCPLASTFIHRKFNEERQISEQEVEEMLDALLSSPALKEVASLIEKRLGRPLEPFDIWYNGFSRGTALDEDHLDSIVSRRYPAAEAFRNDIPDILLKLGFSKQQSQFLYKNIDVEASRGTGHAMGHAKRGFPARLRTRIEKGGMNYKGFNIAMHEFGHNVEQVFSLNMVDHFFLAGVPNNACTEAIAYIFQDRDLMILNFEQKSELTDEYNTIQTYWTTCEISAVALVEMKIWNWLYANPDATPDKLKNAVIKIAKDVWNKYYANVIGKRDVEILAIYSHMFFTPLYLADYPLGHLISYQIEEKLKSADSLGKEIERITSYGNLTPDLWMINATGRPLSPQPLLKATHAALKKIQMSQH